MDAYSVYRDIQKRTKGQFLIGVVGPVRTGKSTLIRRFLEVLALPYLSEKEQAEVRDALPLSGEGKTITTVEPKFVPKDAVELQLGEGDPIRLRLIDCVGFLVPDAAGNLENENERMVKTVVRAGDSVPGGGGDRYEEGDRRTFHDRSYGDVRRIVRRAAAGEFSAGGGTDRCGAQKAGKALPDSCECEKTVPGGDTAAGKGA